MNRSSKYGKMIIGFVLIAIICITLFYSLWNWLMPKFFGLQEVTVWEAIGFLFLSRIIFGGIRQVVPTQKKCNELTDKDKESFNAKFSSWCNKEESSKD